MLPLGVLDQDRGVDGRRKVGGEGRGPAAGRGNARQRLGKGQQRVDTVAAYAAGLDRIGVVHVWLGILVAADGALYGSLRTVTPERMAPSWKSFSAYG